MESRLSPICILYCAWKASLLVPPMVLFGTLYWRRPGLFRGALLSFAMVYGLIVGAALLEDHVFETRLNRFDRNGDSFFTGDEISPEQEEAMRHLTNDTGRVFAPILAGIFGVGYTALIFGGAAVALRLRDRWRSRAR